MKITEITNAVDQLELQRLIHIGVNRALKRCASVVSPVKLAAPKPTPLPAPKKQATPKHKTPQPFTKPPRSKRQLAAIHPVPPQ